MGKKVNIEDSDDEDPNFMHELMKDTQVAKKKIQKKPDAYEGMGIIKFYRDQKQNLR